jgi:hypothetical protein
MKALKTIVATTVIVFAFTTVAVAGVRHVGSQGDSKASAAGHTALQTHQGTGVTHTDAQSARHLRAVGGQHVAPHATQAGREMTRDRARDHSLQTPSDPAAHVQAHERTQSHDRSGHPYDGDGNHDGGTHDGGSHHDGGTHSGGTHHE